MGKTVNIWVATLAIVILISCAQEKAVTGGKKDTTPPEIVSSNPENLATNFDSKTITMDFDEFVLVKNLSSELIVSPPLEYPVKYKVKGKKVIFEIKDTLLPNATYNFNFGNAIVDLNEGNPLDSSLFVLSTGSEIDSLKIIGEVKDAYTLKPLKAITVLLFNSLDDSAVYKGNPSYISKTDEKGMYSLQYLQEGNYQIYALTNPNSSYGYYVYDKMGFYEHSVNPVEIDSVNFMLFEEVDTNQYVSKYFSSDYFSFVTGFYSELKKPNFSFTPSGDDVEYYVEEIAADSFKFWMAGDLDIDSVSMIVSDQTGYADTVNVDISEREDFYKKLKKKKQTKSPLKIGASAKSGVLHYFDTLRITCSRPPISWRTDSIYFVEGSDTTRLDSMLQSGKLKMDLPTKIKGTSRELKSLTVLYPWEQSTSYAFLYYPGAFKDVINQTNDTSKTVFKTNTFEDYGSFKLTVETPKYSGKILVELLDGDGKFIRNYSLNSGGVIYHELAVPGKYKLRLVLDENDNKKWDSGSLTKRKQAETIVYYKSTIEVRANWDVEETWIVDFK